MAWSTLADLPTELLLLIFHQLSTDTILTVGKLCRRLNSVAIPFFLDRMGLPDPQALSVLKPLHDGYGDTLTGLTLNFSMTEIKQLVCILDNRQGLTTITSLTRTIRRMHHLFLRLSSLASLRLVLRTVGETWTLRSEFVEEFIITFLSLLETTLLKSCQSLQIIHSQPVAIASNYSFQVLNQATPSTLQNITQFLTSRLLCKAPNKHDLRGDGWRYQLISRDGSTRAPSLPLIRSQSRLAILDLSSDLLLVPPISIWTIELIKHSHITSLSLSLPRNVTREEFHHFLFPEIVKALPLLQELKVAFPRDDFLTTVVENLAHLQSLRKIVIALVFYGSLPPISTHTIKLDLPYLSTFTGSLAQAAYLFGSPITFPNLKFVNIIMDFYFRDNYDHAATVDAFSVLGERFSALEIKPSVSVCLSNNIEPPSPSLNSRTLGEDPDGAEYLSIVSRLALTLPIFFLDDAEVEHQAEHVLAWLDVFHELQDLTLITRRVIDITDAPAREARDSTLHTIITTQYPNITSFNVVDLLFDEYHYHWSNFRDDLTRGIDGIPTITTLRNKTTAPCVCSDF